MDGDERPGDAVYCAYCKAPLKIAKTEEDEDLELEEDFSVTVNTFSLPFSPTSARSRLS